MKIVDCEDLHMDGCAGLGGENRAGLRSGEEDRCQDEDREDAEPGEDLQSGRGRVQPGIGCHCNGSFVGDLIIVKFPSGKMGGLTITGIFKASTQLAKYRASLVIWKDQVRMRVN